MKHVLLVLLIVPLFSQSDLPHGLTDDEKLNLHLIGVNRTITDPPDSIVFAPAEFDSVAGVIFAWEQYYTLLKQMIKETAESDTAWVVVNGSSEETTVTNELNSYGVNMDRVEFIYDNLNSVWIRDYGPWWIYQPDGTRAVIDLDYNRPRPQDDAFPEDLANLWNLDYYGLGLVEAGGNMLLDGKGAVLLSNVIFDASQGFDPNLTVDQLETYFDEYFGVHKVIITDHLNNDGTGHIDMFVKVINDTTVIVGEYAPGTGATGNAEICDQVADQIANETNGEGRPFNVIRMLMPDNVGGVSYTYINSLIVNKKIYVPVYGFQTDAAVLAQYESIVPEYEIIGYDCNQIITANGAIHCITMKVPAMIEWVDPCEDWILGDVNNDGNIDVHDLLSVADIVLGFEEPGICSERVADINEDQNVTAMDLITLLNLIMGW
ncbi:MAG: agmatine deiminase family protein [Candidatus Marinimicrobia bacterium]|nr:agmatine deiminase family protein [Candidatus Neomarinimicrobiota bacterium]